MVSTLWLFLCLALFAQNLIDLMSNRHQLSYKIVEQGDVLFDADHDLNYLVCTPFWKIKRENTLTYELETQIASARSFLNHSIVSIERRLKVKGLFSLNESAIFNEHVCFPTTKSELEKERMHFNKFLRVYGIQSIFIYSKEKQPNFYERAHERNNGLYSIYLRAYKKKVFKANHLLNADCSNRAHQIHHDRFTCLNRCFKKNEMSSGFYRFDDEGTFDLSELLKEKKRIAKREANKKEEALKVLWKLPTFIATEGAEDCLKRCPKRSCFWEVVISMKIDYDYYVDYLQKEEGKEKVDLQLNTYAAFYSMNDFYLQLFGLLTLFTGTSVLRLLHSILSLVLSVATRKIEPLLRNEKLLRIFRLILSNLKHVPTLLCFVLFLVQGLAMVNEFRFHSNYPNRTSSLNFSSEPFSVVICFIRFKADASNLRKLTFNSIEEASNSLLSERTKSIEIYSGNKRIEPKFSDEVLFKSSKYNDSFWLSRCFRVDLDLNEKYRQMALTYLKISFSGEYREHREVFLIERHQNFTSGLVNFRGLYYPQKVTKIHSKSSVKSNCRDYSGEEGCGSRRNCLDRCLSTKFIKKHKRIPTNTIVNKNDLNPYRLIKKSTFSETVDEEVNRQCFALFNQTDCNEVRFEESPDRVNTDVSSTVFIRLSYMNIVEREMGYDWMKTLLDIVSLQTILFGLNALGMLTTVLLFLCRVLRLKWRRAYSMFLFLLTSVGFLVHNVLVFRAIISGDLQENEFFEKLEWYSLPSPILCFPIGKEVDENYRVTGKYLDNLTGGMTFKHAFWVIRYSNRTHEKDLYIGRLNSTKSSRFYSSSELELSHFYYLTMKCFKISLKVRYREEDFFLLKDKIVLKIYLKYSFSNQMNSTIFLHQQADSKEIGGGFNLTIGKWILDSQNHYSYGIEFEQFRIVRNDQFEILKHLKRLFQERVQVNDAKTAEAMRRRFKEDHNRTTDHLPLDGHSDVEVDNQLYEQYTKTAIDQSPFKSLNFEQNIANTYTNVAYPSFTLSFPYFSFSFSFLVRRVVITNRENYTKLVVSLLNTLSLWVDICVIDMGAWFSRFFALALQLYLLLIKISNRLDRLRQQ